MYIGIIGHMGHGKTTQVGSCLETHGFKRFHPAHTLRRMLTVFLTDLGYTQDNAYRLLEGDLKRAPLIDFPSCTPTTLQQTLGTEWGRRLVDPDVWNRILQRRLDDERQKRGEAFKAYNDSIRFPDEAGHVIKQQGFLIKVIRPGAPISLSHASEQHIPHLPYHFLVTNDEAAPGALQAELRSILQQIRKRPWFSFRLQYPEVNDSQGTPA